MDIDFVVMWVDAADEQWKKEKSEYLLKEGVRSNLESTGEARYRDWGLLKYWFRCIEKNAPWVRKIHFVTNGQVPSWLDLANDRLELNTHSSFMNPDSLPSFNAASIEMQLGNIETLSEHFVLFNDDMFLIQPISPSFFFQDDGKRADFFCERHPIRFMGTVFSRILHNDIDSINSLIDDKRTLISRDIGFAKWFSPQLPLSYRISNALNYVFSKRFVGFSVEHIPFAYKKSYFDALWDELNPVLSVSVRNKFRSPQDLNQYLLRYYSIITNDYFLAPATRGVFCTLKEYEEACKAIKGESKSPLLCVNDVDYVPYDEQKVERIREAFLARYSEKSSFEL